MKQIRLTFVRLLVATFILWPQLGSAHKPSDSYLSLRVDGQTLRGRWDIALRDLEFTLGLDGDHAGRSPGASCGNVTKTSPTMRFPISQ